MKDQNVSKAVWATPKLTVYGKVEEITQDIWKKVGPGDGTIICIADNPVTVTSCTPGSC